MTSGAYEPIELRDVSLTLSGNAVMKDLSLTLPGSGSVCLFGPSGCGKTTLIRMLAGLITPQSGIITGLMNRKPMTIFQEDRLLPWLTARENVALVMREPDMTSVESLLNDFGLQDAMDKTPDALSGGMRRRVALARGLAYGGDLLLLDEPFQGLDDQMRHRIIDTMVRSRGDGLLVLVSHDRREALRVADRIYDFSGPPLTLLSEREGEA